MPRYVALLRGINVGGKTAVPMAELRAELEKLGLGKVKTHLNSGNALFESPLEEAALESMVEDALGVRFGFHIPVLVRSAEEIHAAAEGLPFSSEQIEYAQEAAGDAPSLYMTFLSAPLPAEAAQRMASLKKPGETCVQSGRILYLLLEHSIRACKLFSSMDKLDARATSRNWNTVSKLDDMLRG